MAKGPRYQVPYRRRREGKTDYQARRTLATSDRPRLVVRPSNKSIVIQLVRSKIVGDEIITQAHSKDLKGYGWLGGEKNTSAAYLLGLLAGYKALKGGVEEANLVPASRLHRERRRPLLVGDKLGRGGCKHDASSTCIEQQGRPS